MASHDSHSWADLVATQAQICARYAVSPHPVTPDSIVGISASLAAGAMPANGLRHPSEQGQSGWYLWGGEHLSDAPDFFQPVHASHLVGQRPDVIAYLGLPAGWRFLLAPGYEDIWYDATLLNIDA